MTLMGHSSTKPLYTPGENLTVRQDAFRLNKREIEVLCELAAFARQAEAHTDWHPQWAKPMDVGGRDGSHHSYTLRKLARSQPPLVEVTARSFGHRGSYRYRITEHGKKVVDRAKRL